MKIRDLNREVLNGNIEKNVEVTLRGQIQNLNKNLPFKYQRGPSAGEIGYRHTFDLSDTTASIGAVSFEELPEDVKLDSIVEVTMKTGEHGGKAQLTFDKFTSTIRVLDESEYDIHDYVSDLVGPVEKLQIRLDAVLSEMKNEQYLKLINHIMEKDWFKQAFWTWRAAKKNHHAVVGGLALHTISMMEKALASFNNSEYKFDKELVVTACFLHDLGKIWELDFDGNYTKNSLMGHIVLSYTVVYDAYKDGIITSELMYQLSHAVLAHHGKLEWGSPVTPSTIEAQKVHLIDMDDANEYAMTEAQLRIEKGEISEQPIWPLGNIYMPQDTSYQTENALSYISDAPGIKLVTDADVEESSIEVEDEAAIAPLIKPL